MKAKSTPRLLRKQAKALITKASKIATKNAITPAHHHRIASKIKKLTTKARLLIAKASHMDSKRQATKQAGK